MKVRAILVGAGIAALGGFALYDYYSPESRRARALHEVETLKPDVKPHACLPQGPLQKAFAAAVALDAMPPTTFDSDARKRGVIKHDCIRGASQHSTLDRLLDATGEEIVTYSAQVVESCQLGRTEYPLPQCVALDVLGRRADTSKAAVAALEKIADNRKLAKEVWEGALFRLMTLPEWHTPAQLATQLASEPEWEARELLLEKVRERRDPSTRASLETAYAKEDDETTKGRIKAALLELDNPGKCVVEDEGLGEDGICRYLCRDQNTRLRYPKEKGPKDKNPCPLVHEPEGPSAAGKAGVNSAALAK
ncbi:MAG TPA: hypothetical protein VKB92_13565 [Myxococcales bacterium]|nr:hypothetical protein [Myxococcales bacterium]